MTEQVHTVTEIARPEDVLPTSLHLLPLERKPFFPGQILPVILDVKQWGSTLKAIQKAGQGAVGVVYSNGVRAKKMQAKDFCRIGTVCKVHQIEQHENQFHVVLAGLQRFEIVSWVAKKHPFIANVNYLNDSGNSTKAATQIRAYTTAIVNTIKELLPLNPMYGEELKIFLSYFSTGEPSRLADFGASLTTADASDLQEVLESVHLLKRMEKTLVLLQKEVEVAQAQTDIREHIEGEITQYQREMFLREQLKFIQKELGISKDGRESELDVFFARLEKLDVPAAAEERIDDEMKKMAMLEQGSPEYTVTRNYLDWATNVPWNVFSKDSLNLKKAAQILDEDHEGLKEVKQRILEFIGVGKMKGQISGSIVLLVGPPGVGKTSLGRSIARTLGREFYRFSVGGMHDEAEIKGHRRTYIGAMPGKFIQALNECKTSNPVIMLDEIDKIGTSFRGDPASALLEVLDPEQNKNFLDHYLDLRVDLSNVLFICTANQLDSIPLPLLDRMEEIRLSGYLSDEKIAIARKHLLPKKIAQVGLKNKGQLRVDTTAIRKIIEQYAREAGVRRLEKLLGKIARKAVLKILKKPKGKVHVTLKNLEDFVGKPLFTDDNRISGVGVVTGLAWTSLGGVTLDIEASRSHSFRQGFKLTGQLGDVMKESAEIAYSYVIGNAESLGIEQSFFEKSTIHLHVPAGATPKDGPSAGITMTSALISLAKNKAIKKSFAMTGEISLTGQVLPVGGIREKVIAARRMKIKKLILPQANQTDFDALPDYIKKGISVHFASHYNDVLKMLF